MDSKAKLYADIESGAFRKGVENAFWELDSIIGNRIYVWLFAPDLRSYLMELECSSYGDEPIQGSFIDPTTRQCDLSAYPRGTPVFEGWIKFQSTPPFICWDQDRGSLEIGGHADWRPRAAWKTNNQIVSYLDFIRGRLNIPECGYLRTPTRLIVPSHIFNQTLATLEIRSAGKRESAAILIGNVDGLDWTVNEVRFHHDLCDDKARSHYLELSEHAKFNLYRDLAQVNKEIIALVHTHPKDWVDLSLIDQENQLSSRIGFWSLVVPWYGRQPWVTEDLGMHVRGRLGWNRLTIPEVMNRFILC